MRCRAGPVHHRLEIIHWRVENNASAQIDVAKGVRQWKAEHLFEWYPSDRTNGETLRRDLLRLHRTEKVLSVAPNLCQCVGRHVATGRTASNRGRKAPGAGPVHGLVKLDFVRHSAPILGRVGGEHVHVQVMCSLPRSTNCEGLSCPFDPWTRLAFKSPSADQSIALANRRTVASAESRVSPAARFCPQHGGLILRLPIARNFYGSALVVTQSNCGSEMRR